jgi:molecular chaperone GrpE (heat shock protein)
MFKRKKMNQHDPFDGEIIDDEPVKIPVNDKRRFTEDGLRDDVKEETQATPQKSPREIELEGKLKTETERREAAEAKLVGVQAKFDEAKSNLEKETADMRARLMKTLEDRSKQGQFNFLITLLPVLDNLNLAVSGERAGSVGRSSSRWRQRNRPIIRASAHECRRRNRSVYWHEV